MSNDMQRQKNTITKGEAFGLLYWFADAHATTLAVFMRRGFGREALGLNSLAGFGMMAVWMAHTHDTMMYVLIACWFMAQIWQRVRTWRLLSSGVVLHSKYAGFPYWAVLISRGSEEKARWVVEPMMCLLGGGLITIFCESIGFYIMAGAVTFLVRQAIEWGIERRRVEAMKDAMIEAQYYGDRLQK